MIEQSRSGSLSIVVRPGKRSTCLVDARDGWFGIDIAALPIGGEVNKELCAYLKCEFGIIGHIVSGASSRKKRLHTLVREG